MAFPITLIWEVETSGSDTANGGNFDPNNANMATDLTGTLCNTSSPSVTSASYSFNGSTDTNSWLYIKSGGTFQAGWYQINSCSAGAAILNAGVGYSVLSLPGSLCASVVAGGTSYSVGDTITLTGGGPAAVLIVLAVSSGVVTRVGVSNRGFYFSQPSNPVSQASSSGSGTGATFNVNWMASSQGRSPTFGELASVGCASTASPNSGVWTVDYSQVGTAPWAISGMTSSGAGLVVLTSAAVPSWVGNGIRITGGTNFNVGIYNISSVVTGTSMTLVGAGNSDSGVGASGTANVGGALASPGMAASVMAASNTIFVAGTGTYTINSATPNVAGGCVSLVAGTGSAKSYLSGYSSARGDFGRPTLKASGISTFTMVLGYSTFSSVQNLIVNGNSLTLSRGVQTGTALNIKALNFKNSGLYGGVSGFCLNCEVTGCSVSTAILSDSVCILDSCWAHDNTVTGIWATVAINCLSTNNTGATSDGFGDGLTVNSPMLINCTAYGNGRNGLYQQNTNEAGQANNCIFYGNGAYGANGLGCTLLLNCAFGANTTAPTNGLNRVNVVNSITLTANPFSSVSTNDFSLNNTAGGGALLRAAGIPGVMPGGLSQGFGDVGALQHQDSGGGGSGGGCVIGSSIIIPLIV